MRGHVVAILVVLSSVAGVAGAQPGGQRGTDAGEPTVELITMGVGALIWEKHGHVALCLRYPDPRRDHCYNYGTAEFQRPLKMGWGFFRGTKSFWVSIEQRARMLRRYEEMDRTIYSQMLPLEEDARKRLVAALQQDLEPNHRYYAYDHFFDNCSTRIRDLIDEGLDGTLSKNATKPLDVTFRDLARAGFVETPLALLITDVAMGRSTDRRPTEYEAMFLPDYLREAVHKYGGVEPVVLYQRQGPPLPAEDANGRGWLALALLVLTAPVVLTKLWGRYERAGLAVALIPQVLLGLVFWGLAIISPLAYVRFNETLWILLPLDLLLLLLPAAKRALYARLRLAQLGVVVILMVAGTFTQPLWPLLLWPLVPAAAVAFWPRRHHRPTAAVA